MPAAVLNSREYPALAETFEHDLRVQLGLPTDGPAPVNNGQLPTDGMRTFDVTVTAQKRIFCTEVSIGSVVRATWAVPTPLGGAQWLTVQLPEEQRAALASTTGTGDDLITAVADATRPQAEALLDQLWGAG